MIFGSGMLALPELNRNTWKIKFKKVMLWYCLELIGNEREFKSLIFIIFIFLNFPMQYLCNDRYISTEMKEHNITLISTEMSL